MCRLKYFITILVILVSCATDNRRPEGTISPEPSETHLEWIRQITFDGDNGEAYFSRDGRYLIFQSKRAPYEADQIFIVPAMGGEEKLVSTGKGRCTCGYFIDDRRILFSSTHASGDTPPPAPDKSHGYVWPLYEEYEIYVKDLETGSIENITNSPGYDAEATVSPDGTKIVFTSMRDGNPELYVMDLKTREAKRITNSIEYDGGAVFSPDGTKIVYRASVHDDGKGMDEYMKYLAMNLIKPTAFELYICNADGSDNRRLTNLGRVAFAPAWHPSGKKIIFTLNEVGSKSRNYELYMIDVDGTNLERITFNDTFDGFPMFSPDGKYLVFNSNRCEKYRGQTNVFVAKWKE